jgi:hypothetical protein
MTYYFQTRVWIRTLIWIHSSHLLNPDLPGSGSGINWNIPERERERMIVLYQLNCQKVHCLFWKRAYPILRFVKWPEFAILLRGPGIDSQPGGPVQQPYLTYRPARLHRLAESIDSCAS